MMKLRCAVNPVVFRKPEWCTFGCFSMPFLRFTNFPLWLLRVGRLLCLDWKVLHVAESVDFQPFECLIKLIWTFLYTLIYFTSFQSIATDGNISETFLRVGLG
jgi:hypothetical protein